MNIQRIYYTKQFLKEFKQLPPSIQKLADKKELLFRNNPFDISLKTHKLVGKLDGFLAFSVNYQYRIIFLFENTDQSEVTFFSIGTHAIYN